MLQTKINDCIDIINEVQVNKDRKEGNETIAKRNNRFFDAFSRFLLHIATSLKAIRALPEFVLPEELHNKFNKYLNDTETALANKSIANPDTYHNNLSKVFSEFSSAWIDKTRTYNKSLLDELAILRMVHADKKEIQQICNGINNIQSWPVTDDMVKIYNNAKGRGEELLSKIKFDDDIKEFLQKVNNKQASLLDLNDKILKWIKEEQLENKFILSINSLI